MIRQDLSPICTALGLNQLHFSQTQPPIKVFAVWFVLEHPEPPRPPGADGAQHRCPVQQHLLQLLPVAPAAPCRAQAPQYKLCPRKNKPPRTHGLFCAARLTRLHLMSQTNLQLYLEQDRNCAVSIGREKMAFPQHALYCALDSCAPAIFWLHFSLPG